MEQYKMRFEWMRDFTAMDGYKYFFIVYIYDGRWIACTDKYIAHRKNNKSYFKFAHWAFSVGGVEGMKGGFIEKECSKEYAEYILKIGWL